jgi:hypothetical protein
MVPGVPVTMFSRAWLKVVHGAGDETAVRALRRRLGWTDGDAAHEDLWFISTRCGLISTT